MHVNLQTPGCSPAFASSIHSVPAPLPRSLPEAAALAVSPGSFHPQGYTTFTIIHCHGRQVGTTAEGKISEEVEGHKGQLPVCPHQRGQASPTCGYRFTATSASAHCELGLAWQRLQGTMHRALPHGSLIPGGGTDREKERRGRRIRIASATKKTKRMRRVMGLPAQVGWSDSAAWMS